MRPWAHLHRFNPFYHKKRRLRKLEGGLGATGPGVHEANEALARKREEGDVGDEHGELVAPKSRIWSSACVRRMFRVSKNSGPWP